MWWSGWCSTAFSWCFLFQAEDGIRDVAVTGVQTCALPISNAIPSQLGAVPLPAPGWEGIAFVVLAMSFVAWNGVSRSEERRVGKECSGRVFPELYGEK